LHHGALPNRAACNHTNQTQHDLFLLPALNLAPFARFAFSAHFKEVMLVSINFFFQLSGPVALNSTPNPSFEPSKRTGLPHRPLKKPSWFTGSHRLLLLALACCTAFATFASAQVTIMKGSVTPSLVDSNDSAPVEVGVKFRSDTNGFVTGLRFYKASSNGGTHVGHIWSTTGVLLGSATFTGESRSGWQQVTFPSPVPVSANTTYIASYLAPRGHYSANTNYFTTKGVDSPPLHALANGVSGPDGVYLYASAGGFPTSTYQSTYYWVDVVFTSTQAPAANAQLTESATTLNFGSVAVNSSATQSVALTSSGAVAVTVNSASIKGTGFTLAGGTFPVTLNPGQSLTLQLQYKPTVAGSNTGQLTISSTSTTGGTATVALSGTGTSGSPQLTESATTLNFGSVAVNSTATQSVALTSSGTSPLTVNSASVTGSGFSIVGGSFPITLNPKQSMTVQVQFKPAAGGSATGQLMISSNSTTGGTAAVALGGTGTSSAHEVDLTWGAPASSADEVAGYNVYRSMGGATPQLMNAAADQQTTYVDKNVVSGAIYDYFVKSVDSSGVESTASNQISVTIP
jgi:Domain of unknown function (DUF4082)/Abnormal spindle-like microcephaly-assoc'd, ASPM-SPD-2-Hydin